MPEHFSMSSPAAQAAPGTPLYAATDLDLQYAFQIEPDQKHAMPQKATGPIRAQFFTMDTGEAVLRSEIDAGAGGGSDADPDWYESDEDDASVDSVSSAPSTTPSGFKTTVLYLGNAKIISGRLDDETDAGQHSSITTETSHDAPLFHLDSFSLWAQALIIPFACVAFANVFCMLGIAVVVCSAAQVAAEGFLRRALLSGMGTAGTMMALERTAATFSGRVAENATRVVQCLPIEIS